MQGRSFYHSLMRKYVITFGDIFNGITVRRFNKTGKAVQNIPVPIKYGAMSQYMADILTPPEGERVSITMPMMSFFDVAIAHDPERQMIPIHQFKTLKVKGEKSLDFVLTPVPYKITMELSIITKTTEDANQIVEQILPFFVPSITQSVNLIDGFDNFDIPVALSSISKEQAYENERQVILYTLTFEMSVWLLGATSNQGLIKKSIVSLISDESKTKITTTPGLTPDGKPTSIEEESIDYLLIKPDDDYGYIEKIEDFVLEE